MIPIMILGKAIGTLIIVLMLFYRALISLMNYQSQWNLFLNMSGAIENFNSFVGNLVFDELRRPKGNDISFSSSIILEKVFFKFSENDRDWILKDLSFAIKKGESIGIVGASGSGKSTTVNLILGIFSAQRGKVLVDGLEIDKINKSKFRRKIGYVSQEPIIFNDSIYNNVTFWQEKSKENVNKFWRVLEIASIKGYVLSLHRCEDTELGMNGIQMSGGQKQRLNIARELFKDIDILILDEATSAMDTNTERELQDNIDELKGSYTLISITHRLSTVKNFDKIVLLNESGTVESIGDFKFLKRSSNLFNQMLNHQNL
jgi:subfamily B ATP-binding cassette protein MsbA